MVRGGKVSSKRNFRRRVRSKEGVSDDSDEDYVVPDEGRDVSDCSEDSCYSLDGCTSEESFDNFVEDEEEEIEGMKNFRRSKTKNGVCGQLKIGSTSEESFDNFVEDEEEEIEGMKNFRRSKTKNGVCGRLKIGSKASQKRGRMSYAEQLDEVKEEEEEDEYKEEDADEDEEEDVDEDFDCDDDEEFTPEEEDYSDEEEELRGRKKKSNSIKMGKKVLPKRVSITSRGRKRRRNSRAARKPLRKKRRKNGRLRRKVKCDDEGDSIDNRPAIRTKSKKKASQKRRRVIADSDSDCVSSGSSDYEYTISEEEREQVREAEELCGILRTNLRSSSLLIKNEEVRVHEDIHQQRKPPVRKGKEKIEELQGRKGKSNVEDLKSEVGKQVCGICFSEENKRRVRGVLNCCTHYFCFACIMEWAKVESRCPLCKQRFQTISKPVRSTAGIDLRGSVIQVPERDQVYQPSEEELRSYIDPYEYVICSECHQGGDDDLMLLCDLCDSPAHTYCVGLGREVPEGNWYCDGCRPVALGSSSSQVQECAADPRMTIQSLPGRPSPVGHARESIDLNLMSSPRTSLTQGFGNLSSSRFSGRSVDGASPVSGGGAPTLSERRWIHRQIQQLLSIDRMTSTTGRSNGISATSSTGNLYSSQIDQSRETTTQDTRTQDVGTSYHRFFEERLCNNTSPLMQNGDLFSMRINNSRRPVVQDSTSFTNRAMNGAFWPGLVGTPPLSDYEQVHRLSSSSNFVTDGSMSSAIREESNLHIAKEQLSSMVKSHLNRLSQDIDLGYSTTKDITRISLHTILAACGLEHSKSEVCAVPPPSACPHIELMAGGQTSLIKGCCSSCFDSFVGDVVKRIMDTRMSQWLRLGL